MTKSKSDHCTIRNGDLFCTHCGGKQFLELPMNTIMVLAISNAFQKIHKDCKKTWEQPIVEQTLSEKQKADWWLSNGERGVSSNTMFEVIDGRKVVNHYRGHPSDPDDFRRCYLLLQAIPEWKDKLYLMRPVSSVWENLVDNWDKLTEMLEEQLKTHKANGMYEFMESLGC